jgi:hypothetical protein
MEYSIKFMPVEKDSRYILKMSDALSEGIVKQFPVKYWN